MITTPADITSQDAPRPALRDLEISLTSEQQDALINALSDRYRTINDIAEEFQTSIEALSLYTARPDISKRLDAADQLVARRIRMQATNILPLVIDTLTECVRSFHWEETHIPIDRKNLNALEQRRRARESARKASALLVRLANFQSAPAKQPKVERYTSGCNSGWHAPVFGSCSLAPISLTHPITANPTSTHTPPHQSLRALRVSARASLSLRYFPFRPTTTPMCPHNSRIIRPG